jgi:ubiquinone/menaquinone biosynthesis C-methylase UbiE
MNIKEIYNRLANNYDKNHFSQNSAAKYAEERRFDLICPYLKRSKSLKLLDVACGTGTYLEIARKFGANAVGCDISENMVRICKNKGINNVFVNDYHTLPFKDGTFDLILCINAIHYSDNPKVAMNEIRRVLSKDGTVLFTYFNNLNFRSINSVRKLYKRDQPISKERRYSPFQMKKLLSEGLVPVHSCGINSLPVASNAKPRDERLLKVFCDIESLTRETPLMHFFNEVLVVLKKYGLIPHLFAFSMFHEIFHFFYGYSCANIHIL